MRSFSIFQQANKVLGKTAFNQKRWIVNVSELKGAPKSLIEGAAFNHTGALSQLYDIAKLEKNRTANSELVTALFHKQDESLRPTQNKSHPAYSIKPLLADILYHLNLGTLIIPSVRFDIYTQWRKHHKKLTDANLSRKKMDRLLDKIIAAKAECVAKHYPLNLTDLILSSFIFHAASSQQDIIDHLKQYNNLHGAPSHDLPKEDDFLSFQETCRYLKEIENFESKKEITLPLQDNYQNYLLAFMTRHALDQVKTSTYSPNDTLEETANCGEATYHNLFNILLFNMEKGTFDFGLLPDSLSPNQTLLNFYAMQDFKTQQVNAPEIGEFFMKMMSGHTEFKYLRKEQYELASAPESFLPIINHFFGSNAKTLKELSKQFTNHQRVVMFNQNDNKIDITILPRVGKSIFMVIEFQEKHIGHYANIFFHTHLKNRMHLSSYAANEIEQYPLLLPIVSAQEFMVDKMLAPNADLNYFFTHTTLSFSKSAIDFLKRVTPEVAKHPLFKSFVANMLKTDPTLIDQAVRVTNLTVIQLALEAGANPNEGLINAKNSENVEYLLKAGANPNAIVSTFQEFTPLHLSENTEAVGALIKAGANVHAKSHLGMTPLHLAKDAKIATTLINAGAKVDARNYRGSTPLHTAANASILEILLKAGANPNVVTKNGSPLHSHIQDTKKLKVLIQHNANIHLTDSLGNTPLHIAARYNLLDAVVLLLEYGANTKTVNKENKTPAEVTSSDTIKLTLKKNNKRLNQYNNSSSRP